jgi:hypothetical protein
MINKFNAAGMISALEQESWDVRLWVILLNDQKIGANG